MQLKPDYNPQLLTLSYFQLLTSHNLEINRAALVQYLKLKASVQAILLTHYKQTKLEQEEALNLSSSKS